MLRLKKLCAWQAVGAVFLLLYFAFAFMIALQKPALFEEGVYGKFTLSMLRDGDFNIAKLPDAGKRSWLVTETGNDPTFEHVAISVYLAPFYYFRSTLGPATLSDYLDVHVLSTLIYLALGLFFYHAFLLESGFTNIKKAIVIVFCSTSTFWYSLFCSTTPDSFALAYSMLALGLYSFLRRAPDRLFGVFFLGLVTGLGFAIRLQLFWIAGLFLMWVIEHRKAIASKVLVYVLGCVTCLSGMWLNNSLRSPKFEHPLGVYLKNFHFNDFFLCSLKYSLIGPNGYLWVSPIVLLIAAGCGVSFGQSRATNKARLLFCLMAAPIFLHLFYSFSWVLVDEYVGRLQLDYAFAFAACLALLYDTIASSSRFVRRGVYALSAACVAWHLYVTLCFEYIDRVDGWRWQYFYSYFDTPIALQAFHSLLESISIRPFLDALRAGMVYVPIILSAAALLVALSRREDYFRRRVLWVFFGYGLCAFAIFTGSNFIRNEANVARLRSSGFYQDKVVGNSNEIFFFDDYSEEYKKTLYYYLLRGDCERVEKLRSLYAKFLNKVETSIVSDPIGFKSRISGDDLPKSSLESTNFLEKVRNEYHARCRS